MAGPSQAESSAHDTVGHSIVDLLGEGNHGAGIDEVVCLERVDVAFKVGRFNPDTRRFAGGCSELTEEVIGRREQQRHPHQMPFASESAGCEYLDSTSPKKERLRMRNEVNSGPP